LISGIIEVAAELTENNYLGGENVIEASSFVYTGQMDLSGPLRGIIICRPQ